MSRIRSTFDSVTKAVGSADLISKISRFRPGTPTVGGTNVDKLRVKEEPSVSGGGVAEAASSEAAMTSSERDQDRPLEEESEGPRVKEKPFVVTKTPTQGSPSSIASPPSAVAKHTLQLFHPWALSANMDDTYNTLAKHVNGYFGLGVHAHGDNGGVKAAEQEEEDAASEPLRNQASQTTREHVPVLTPVAEAKSKATATTSSVPASTPEAGALTSSPTYPAEESGAPAAPAPATSPKKGFSHYLSYPRPSVQAFVGSYIAPLVPKFRGESKSTTADKEKSPASVPPEEAAEKSEEGKAAEKAKKLLLTQREKIIARVSVDNRTRALVKGLHRVSDVKLLTGRVEELSRHLLEFPETRGVAVKESVLPCLLRLRQARDPPLQASVREALALVGYADPVKGRGIRVLAIDGGGTRGLMALQTLHKLQDLTGKPIHQLFDYICGVSTGAILAFMLAVFQIPLEECEEMYRKLGSDVFKQNVIVGTVKMGWSHAFYDSEVWENLLKERMGEGLMVESARDPNCPKVSAVSTIVNRGLPLKAHVFRNYRLMPGVRSHYLGDCKHKMWQAIRASSAAPGYFQEFVLGKDLHQDGGLLINNPTALAIHECRCLWPNTPLQCVVSLGTGRYETGGRNSTAYTSLRTKITNVISSATNTEEVHTMLDALLPPDTYFRFNPCLSEDIPLDESRLERLDFLKSEGSRYLERNHAKLLKAAAVLKQEKGAIQRLAEWAKLKTEMYDGLPFSSKL